MKKVLNILLLFIPLLTWATDVQMDSLHCGDVVEIAATPDRGYRFVRWSDGNTDNPRLIEISEAMELSPVYEPTCISDDVPIAWLYGQLMMVNVDSLQQLGYVFSEENVRWYRIVGDMDANGTEANDQQVATGYYYVLETPDVNAYYVAVDVGNTPSAQLCMDVIYGSTANHGRAAQPFESALSDQPLTLVPNYGTPGTVMQLMGLKASLNYIIQVYDAVGRRLEEFTVKGEEQVPIIAQRLPGCYLVCVTDGEGKEVLRYVVKQ